MRLASAYIYLNQARFYAFHGVLPQENRVGGEFFVDLRVGYPIAEAMKSDEVADTLNYAELYALVETEMAKPSRLLEHVAGRIADAIQQRFPQVSSIDLKITKKNPPMGADCEGAGVEIHYLSE
ncbi:dihydroneopterin aldolase [Prevotella sp. P6B1]|uniref:dihydroneopterin aldolase n=1 Tax=Prevotella sp. P6B1 TaxID=1410613 RepID=UPI00051C209D|nr:dihydroneopterin aldolase [Prevotella sp. P6B1]